MPWNKLLYKSDVFAFHLCLICLYILLSVKRNNSNRENQNVALNFNELLSET